jgi:hypothetical protein
MNRPFLRGGLLLLLGLVLGWAIASAVLFVWPPRHTLPHADAAIVLAGGRGPRLQRGLALVRQGVAPVLVVSDGWAPTWPEANRLCAGRSAPVPVVCFHPVPYRTYGEGYLLSEEGMRWNWNHYLPDAATGLDPLASPLLAPDLRGLPPALVIVAECDPLADESEAYARSSDETAKPAAAATDMAGAATPWDGRQCERSEQRGPRGGGFSRARGNHGFPYV